MLEARSVVEREVQADTGRYFSRRVLPYLTADQHLDGVVITFVDLTDRKRAADLVDEGVCTPRTSWPPSASPCSSSMVNCVCDRPTPSFFKAFELSPADVVDQPLFALQSGIWNTPELRRSFDEMLDRKSEIVDFELAMPSDQRGPRTLLLSARVIPSID